MSSPERHARLMSLFDQACDLDAAARLPLLAAVRREDPELAFDLEAMLAQDTAAAGLLDLDAMLAQDTAAAGLLDLDAAAILAEPDLGTRPTEADADRICPECRRRSGASTCPEDGYATVPAHLHDSDADPLVGQVFEGRYRVEGILGRGGMGVVYRATQLVMERPVALKLLLPGLTADLNKVRRFQREARAASRLAHPNIIRIYDFGQSDDGQLFIVSELLEGESLGQLIDRSGPVPPRRTAFIAGQICKALSVAHDHGIVHRDLKAENVFLTPMKGEAELVKVLDFGLAKRIEASASEDISRLTRSGAVLGTPGYMSPEQIEGREVDHLTDLYALGVLMYELLCGRLPFAGDMFEQLYHHLHTAIAPVALAGDTPGLRELELLVMECLCKDPADRPQSAGELVERLAAISTALAGGEAIERQPTVEQLAPPKSSAQRRPVGRWVLALVIVACAAAAGWWLQRESAPGPAPSQPGPALDSPPQRRAPEGSAHVGRARIELMTASMMPFALARFWSLAEARVGRRSPATTATTVVRLTTRPSGATVWDGGHALGSTPLDVVVPEPRRVRLAKAGFRDAAVTLKPGRWARQVRLQRPDTPEEGGATGGSGAGGGTTGLDVRWK